MAGLGVTRLGEHPSLSRGPHSSKSAPIYSCLPKGRGCALGWILPEDGCVNRMASFRSGQLGAESGRGIHTKHAIQLCRLEDSWSWPMWVTQEEFLIKPAGILTSWTWTFERLLPPTNSVCLSSMSTFQGATFALWLLRKMLLIKSKLECMTCVPRCHFFGIFRRPAVSPSSLKRSGFRLGTGHDINGREGPKVKLGGCCSGGC